MHSRIVECEAGDIVVREGDWGNSAFFVLSGEVAVELEAPGEFLSKTALGRQESQKKNTFSSDCSIVEQSFGTRISRRRQKGMGRQVDCGPATNGHRIYFQDVPQILTDFKTASMREGELFGELAALGPNGTHCHGFRCG